MSLRGIKQARPSESRGSNLISYEIATPW